LSQAELDRLAAVAPGRRPPVPTVLVIGSWTHRKGTADWPVIMAGVWKLAPEIRFHFAGTGADKGRVRRDLGPHDAERVMITPHFDADRLSELLAESTVGALPTYVEGFGLSVLETIGAGRPCVVYDVPGPRGLSGAVNADWLVPVGEAQQFAERLASVTLQEHRAPGAFASVGVEFASRFSWATVADATLALYASNVEPRHLSSTR
jgi:glycosyltransferase involved in cell wall biosynthesis